MNSVLSLISRLHINPVHNGLSALGSVRSMSELTLTSLTTIPGSKKERRRVGRGPGSGKGKTSGRGHKGQKARTGGGAGPHRAFEGGQTPLVRRVPKVGFNCIFGQELKPLNLSKLQLFLDMGRLPTDRPITLKMIHDSGIVGKVKEGVKLLADGESALTSPVQIEVTRASEAAIKAVEKAGGSVTAVYYNRLGLRALLKPEKFITIPRFARPPPKLMPYYTDYHHRGYLSPEIQAKKVLEARKQESSS